MPWREDISRMRDIILRIPPLFAMDSILNNSILSYFHFLRIYRYSSASMTWANYFEWLIVFSLFFVICLVIFFLGTQEILIVYSHIIPIASVLASYYIKWTFTVTEQDEDLSLPVSQSVPEIDLACIQHLLYQSIAAFMFCWSRDICTDFPSNSQRITYITVFMSFTLPVFTQVIAQSTLIVFWLDIIALCIPFFILLNDISKTVARLAIALKQSYMVMKLTVQAIGIQGFLENHWIRLHVPKVLRIFFTSRVLIQMGYFYFISIPKELSNPDRVEYYNIEILSNVTFNLVVNSCDSVISLMGLTSIVSFFAHYIGTFMAFCIGSTEDDDKNMGTVSAILFFILALQTGLTGLDPDKRLSRLCKNLYLLGTAITHFVHSMVHPLLMSLSASRNMHVQRHIRALAMCAFLITFPTCLLVYLWSIHKINTWLTAVTAFSLEVIIKVIVSLMVYLLFMLDAYRDKFWESLDDYVYYIQSAGNTIEFLFGIFLFCNGGWILLFESGGTIRAVMMCIHAYFNIWVQAKEGWKVFMKRKTAVNKINSLPTASQEQLRILNDVCAICYQELQNARITQCNHYFHGVCLRKWLYVQDNCPLCYKVIYHPPSSSAKTEEDTNQNDVNNGLQQAVPPRQHVHQD